MVPMVQVKLLETVAVRVWTSSLQIVAVAALVTDGFGLTSYCYWFDIKTSCISGSFDVIRTRGRICWCGIGVVALSSMYKLVYS
jgi:hypothetical protein